MNNHICFAKILFGLLLVPVFVHAETYSYSDLVKRLTDMEGLAVLPPVGEQTALASSYDRKRRYDATTDQYIDWGANGDAVGFVRKEGDSIVMADITGPGCIWRIWSAQALDGHVKIYLDGSKTPTVDLPFKEYFNDSVAPFNRPNLVYAVTPRTDRVGEAGFNNYTPISFQKSCKIVADKGWGIYFQFTYTRFPAETMVPTFQLALAAADQAALDKANSILGQGGTGPASPRLGQQTDSVSINALPGTTSTVANLAGPGAITGLRVHFSLPPDPIALRLFLRQMTVRISWDDQSAAAVWSPLGDFFESLGTYPHASLPSGMLADGTLYAYWYMPFAKTARVQVGNDGTNPVNLKWEVIHAPLDRPFNTLAYFHSKWHRDSSNPMRDDRYPDWPILKTQGRGRFVGTQLNVFQMRGTWWGEGNDKFFVDGEKFPSTIGTGSEDYFGAAWGLGQLFAQAYHGNTVSTEKPMAECSTYRFHISDSIPFQQSLEADIEKYLPGDRVQYAAVAYWYLSPDGTDPYGEQPVTDRVNYWLHPPAYESNLIEGEEMNFAGPGRNDLHYGMDRNASGASFLDYEPGKVGDVAQLGFKVTTAGRYRLMMRFRKAPEGGIFQLSIGDQKLGGPLDFYADKVTLLDPIDMGTVDLKEGRQLLTLTYIGKNPAAKVARPRMGLDYFRLEPSP
jgi:hypothetical protein